MARFARALLICLSLFGTNAKYFPKMTFLQKNSAVTSSSTCGKVSSKYCDADSVSPASTCTEKVCKLGCCDTCHDTSPSAENLAKRARIDTFIGQAMPGETTKSVGFNATKSSKIIINSLFTIDHQNNGFTFSVWVKQTKDNLGALFSKTITKAPYTIIYAIILKNTDFSIEFYYIPKGSTTSESIMITPMPSQLPEDVGGWQHVTVTVLNTELSYFLNGEYVGTDKGLKNIIGEQVGTVRVGEVYQGRYNYDGLMQDIYLYKRVLTNREITEVYSGIFPTTYIISECRCPPTHPKLSIKYPAKCTKNSDKTESDVVLRLSKTSHPIQYVVDDDSSSYWLSEITDDVVITMDLLYGPVQVFFVTYEFYGQQPAAYVIEKSTDHGLTYQPWQYYANDCAKSFDLVNNGPFLQPDTVTCKKHDSSTSYNKAVVNFQPYLVSRLSNGNCKKLYCSPKLLDFIKVTHIRMHFYNHSSNLPENAKYFGLHRLSVSGRCDCYGNAVNVQYIARNATNNGSCVCDCEASTNTEGNHCDRCKSLYNNKPFKRAELTASYPCVKCECNEHATTCYYNQTLDTDPTSRTLGGGGVCIGCQHNTTGQYCHVCQQGFYRDYKKLLNDPNVCLPCKCSGSGVKPGAYKCVKDNSNTDISPGQCECKDNVSGLLCDKCKPGFYDLNNKHASGCINCDCDIKGTRNASTRCDVITGQCLCKDNVLGRRCDQCKAMFFNLAKNNTDGCEPCSCSKIGSQNMTCDPNSGDCACKTNVVGRQCDRCDVGYHSLDQSGCKQCSCSGIGTETTLSKRCEQTTGRCKCKAYVTGFNCDRCKVGYFKLSASKFGCTKCPCNKNGTVTNTNICHNVTGSCSCKRNVTGVNCDTCPQGYFNLSSGNDAGCERCKCYPKGTIEGHVKNQDQLSCDKTTGKCSCLNGVQGLKCNQCKQGYVWNRDGEGCVHCNCHINGSRSISCNNDGICDCKTGIGGQFCDRCMSGYHSFDKLKGSCIKCDCHLAGVKRNECDAHGCQLSCKVNVQGKRCDTCKPGTNTLKQENPFGCSGAISQQGAPTVQVVSSQMLRVSWDPPDKPNGLIISYVLYRNNTKIYTGLKLSYEDAGLQPYTIYSYYIKTSNDFSSIRSLDDAKVYRTLQDIPTGLKAPIIKEVTARTGKALWSKPTRTNGIITKYVIESNNTRDPNTTTHYDGAFLKCNLANLRPYTTYNFTVSACTIIGCARSAVTQVNTLQSAPDSQPAPVVMPLVGGRQFSITWDEPATANGVIHVYEVYERSQPFVSNNRGVRIYSYRPLLEPGKYRNTTRSGLRPFTFYEYRVSVFTVGQTMSNWTRQRTAEDVPSGEHRIQPTSYAVSSSQINITWNKPLLPNGYIRESRVFIYTEDSNYSTPSLKLTVNDSLTTLISDLKPFTTYKFTIITCNNVGCTGHSSKTESKTLASAPSGQDVPHGYPVNSSYTTITWQPPTHPNGPSSVNYHVLRAYAALHYPPINAVNGAHFPGFGYYKLSDKVIPAGSTTHIDLWFRTQYQDGLLVLLASSGNQEDYLAIELRGGKVYLIFNCGTGELVLTSNTTRNLNDDQWHSLSVTRFKKQGTLIIDSQFISTGESAPGSTIIDTNTGVFMAGISDDFKPTTALSNTVHSLKNRKNFIGCLKNIRLQKVDVDFTTALEQVRVDPLSSGCPQGVDEGVYLKGGGYMSLKKGVFIGEKFVGYTLKFEFRTQHNSGLLLFTYGDAPHNEYLAILLNNGDINVYYQTAKEHGKWTVTTKQDLCDGAWHELEFVNFGQENFVLNIDSAQAQIVKPIRVLKVSSELYFGGVPHNSEASDRLKGLGLAAHAIFGGCIRAIRTSRQVVIQNDVSVAENSDLSGCPRNIPLKVDAKCQTPSSKIIYSGQNTTTQDSNLVSFTDYLYRIESRQTEIKGSGKSPWVAIRSGEGAPENIPAPRVEALLGGRTVNVSWSPPEIYNGILRHYQLRAYNAENTTVNVISKNINNVDIFNDIITNLIPYTKYNITVTASTLGGSGESTGTQVTTLESVPEGIFPPEAHRFPYHLIIHWRAPLKPNGVITAYSLMVDSKIIHRYLNQTFNMTGLAAYSKHKLELTACTKIGCGKSAKVEVYTAEIAPDNLSPPHVTIRDSRSAEVRWQKPGTNNGKMIGYRVTWVQKYDATQRGEYNSSVTEFSYLVKNLTAGTWYNFYITAINGGGSTRSAPTTRRTVESSPEEIPAPMVRGQTPHSILVIIRRPLLPNGNITRYELYEVRESGEVLVMNGSLRNYTKTGLLPYSAHSFRTAACTVKGCGTSDIGTGYTLEITPNGSVSLNITIVNATSVLAQWTTIHTPNGALKYGLIVEGLFLIEQTKFVFRNTTRVVASVAHVLDTWSQSLEYTSLLPYSTFRFQINASNSVGYILSNSVYGETKQGIPIGLTQPNVTILNSTAAHITWLPPARDNGVLQYYTVIRTNPANNETKKVNASLQLSMVMVDLEPYTQYQFQVSANTQGGVAYSVVTIATTDEDIPEQIDPPSISDIDSRSMVVKWNHPTTPNGRITHYLLYKNNVHESRISNDVTNVTMTGLEPYTKYYYVVAACTIIGCSNSTRSRDVWTLQDVPEGQQAPILSHSPGPSVLIRWLAPNITNGIISEYEIQRRSQLDPRPISLQKINATAPRSHTDETVSPCTQYSYRVIAFTGKGAGTPSSWSNITTMEGAPDSVPTPQTSTINSTAIYVLWSEASSRCTITHYIIKVVNNDRNYTSFETTDLTYIVNDLLPYTENKIVIAACTRTACRDSAVSISKTDVAIPRHQPAPTATPLSSTSLRVKWDDPIVPAGIIINFLLFRRTLDEPLTKNFTAENDYKLIYPIGNDIGSGIRHTFDDTGLAIFSAQQYKVMVVNKQGNTTSDDSRVFRTEGVAPRAGVSLYGRAMNHTSVYLNWTLPVLKLLLGYVKSYEVLYKDLATNKEYAFVSNLPGIETSVVVTHLKPSRHYEFTVVLNNGAGKFPSNKVQERTLDGVPEGFDAPNVRTINSTTIEVVWTEPRIPNGKITRYSIYANDDKKVTINDLSHNLTSLIPFTMYKIEVEVCTVYACVKSQPNNAKTLASVPRLLRAPRLVPGRRNMVVIWEPPERPNGIMLEYHLYKLEPRPCPTRLCTYIECKIHEQLCGSKCYDPRSKVCCKDVVYEKDVSKTCCDSKYLKKIDQDDVCCGGQFHKVKDNHQCCHGYYRRVDAGQVCCRNQNGSPVIGDGNSCCGAETYDNTSKQCVCGVVYPGKLRQCCGGKVKAVSLVCCGGSESDGETYDYDKNSKCCGSKYIAKSSLCCKSNLGKYEVYSNSRVGDSCCGSGKLSPGLSCCNERPYNASTHNCADKSSSDSDDRMCGNGTICDKAKSASALCDRCDFQYGNLYCGSVSGYYSPNNCGTHSILLMSGNSTFFSYNVQRLQPYTIYSYYVLARNHIGNVTGATATNKTLMAAPEGLDAPRLNVTSATSIDVMWERPQQPHGIIGEYRLTRIEQGATMMVYNGTSLTFTDTGLQPFTGYKYMLEACTSVCANITTGSIEYTKQAAPGNVSAPTLKALSPITVQITWQKPLKPNGEITHYIIRRRNETHDNIVEWNVTTIMKLVDDNVDIEPYTVYRYVIIACTKVGCTSSQPASVRTLQAPPGDVKAPTLITRNSTAIEVIWSSPLKPNGIILWYALYRDDILIYNTSDVCTRDDTCSHIDAGRTPHTNYTYIVEAATSAGSRRSVGNTVKTPESSPGGIQIPTLLPQSSSSILVSWKEPSIPNGVITKYSVIVDNNDEISTGIVGQHLVTGLKPFTKYSFRIKACTVKGCGVGNRGYATTLEATPQGQPPPTVIALSGMVVKISWDEPRTPNGIITSYEVERKVFNQLPIVVYRTTLKQGFVWLTRNSGLQPYTNYSYRIRSFNKAGSVRSLWSVVQTLQGAPENIYPPTVHAVNSTTILVSWKVPGRSNGRITSYTLWSRTPNSLDEITKVASSSRPEQNITIAGLTPNTYYEFRLSVSTIGGTGWSEWSSAQTLDAPPQGISVFSVQKHVSGKELTLTWSAPSQPNGVIIDYLVYSDGQVVCRGTTRQCHIPRRTPFTSYVFQLEACTSGGCNKGVPQTITTAEVPPEHQGSPSLTSNSSYVELVWTPPLLPNGIITRYEVLRPPYSIFNTTDGNTTSYIDYNVKPYTTYKYKIRVHNSAGSATSPGVTIITDQAPPYHVAPPSVVPKGSSTIQVSWLVPEIPNGIITSYVLRRNDSVIGHWSKRTLPLSYTDLSLAPATWYSYQVTACTIGGCTESMVVLVKTGSSRPGAVKPPSLIVLSSTTIEVQWQPPTISNGVVRLYELYRNNISIHETNDTLMFYDTGLVAFTSYRYTVTACTDVGCTPSEESSAITLEATPEGLRTPTYIVIGAKILEIEWTPPSKPNGVIKYYVLYRNDSVVYNGTGQRYYDKDIKAYSYYKYVAMAVNSAGSVNSLPLFTNRTSPGTPENIGQPTLVAISGTQIQVSWTSPNKPNGIITEYHVLYNNIQVNVGLKLTYLAENLKYFTVYNFTIRACTRNPPCAQSAPATARTLEGPPLGQGAPSISNIKARSVVVSWLSPSSPNGIIRGYILKRRSLFTEVVIYNGSLLTYTDTNLTPHQKYQYRVVGYNSKDMTSSPWSNEITTISSIPENVPPPLISDVADTMFKITIQAPDKPNGVITNYMIELNQKNVSEGLTLERRIENLDPFTEYKIRVFACTVNGCAGSEVTTVKTGIATPGNVEDISFGEVTATSIVVLWKPPTKPNGVITRYLVAYEDVCSQNCVKKRSVDENVVDVGLNTSYRIINLQPYTKYQITIQVENKKYKNNGKPVEQRTKASDPEYVLKPVANITGHIVVIDWSKSFDLNGPLLEYILYENERMIFRGLTTHSGSLPDRVDSEFIYVVSATTTVEGVRKTVKSEPLSINVSGVSEKRSGASGKWFRSIWFLVLISLFLILLVFGIVAYCLRKTSGDRTVYIREQDPLPLRSKSRHSAPMSLASNYTPSEAYFNMVDINPETRSYASTVNGDGEKLPKYDWEGYVPYTGNDIEWRDDDNSWSDEEPEIEKSTKYLVFPDTHL